LNYLRPITFSRDRGKLMSISGGRGGVDMIGGVDGDGDGQHGGGCEASWHRGPTVLVLSVIMMALAIMDSMVVEKMCK
jgi:hypothetical protein